MARKCRRRRGTATTPTTRSTTRATRLRTRTSTSRPIRPDTPATTRRANEASGSASVRRPGNNITVSFYFSLALGKPVITGGAEYRLEHRQLQHDDLSLGGPADAGAGRDERPDDPGRGALIAKDPGAYWDTATNKVKGSAYGGQSPRVFPIPLYDPIVYDSGKRNGRNADLMTATGSASSSKRCRATGSGGASSRSRVFATGAGRHRRLESEGHPAGPVTAQRERRDSNGATRSIHRHARRRIQTAGRHACCARAACPSASSKAARPRTAVGPDLVVVDIRADASSGMAAIERLRAGTADMADLRDRRGRRSRPDPAGDARRRQRVLPVEPGGANQRVAGDGGIVPRRRPPDGGAAGGRQRRRPASRA